MRAGRFPQRIKRGSCVVSIYRTPTSGYAAFTVVHYDSSGTRCRRMFNSLAEAQRAAKATAVELAAGNPEVHVLTGMNSWPTDEHSRRLRGPASISTRR
jgi:hypothetical protein